MTKVKSPTQEKSDKKVVEYGLQRVSEWTKKELAEIGRAHV